MILDAQPLIEAIPRPPVSKGTLGYREWYVARKRGKVTASVAFVIASAANVELTSIYPEQFPERDGYDGYHDGQMLRSCSKCGRTFSALEQGQRGAPKKVCQECRENKTQFPISCRSCSRLFLSTKPVKHYCSEYCRNKIVTERQQKKAQLIRNRERLRIVPATCSVCSRRFDKTTKSRAKCCSDECRITIAAQSSGYVSEYPMCPNCGEAKPNGRAVCGKENCRIQLRRSKEPSIRYGISKEYVMVLRACPRCDACKKPWQDKEYGNIDHCHETGKVRGMLCGPCNTALGYAKEDPNRLRGIADYIERTAANK